MLVLSRKVGESVVIGDDGGIRVTLTEIRGDKVRLGILCDRTVPVHREEVFESIKAESNGETKGEEEWQSR